jgi:hypothetical protein
VTLSEGTAKPKNKSCSSIAWGLNPRLLNFEGAQLLPKETPIKIYVMHFSIAWGLNPRLLKRNQTKLIKEM